MNNYEFKEYSFNHPLVNNNNNRGGAVTASQDNVTADEISIDDNTTIGSSVSEDIVAEDSNTGTCTDLNNLIQNASENSEIKLEKDYSYNDNVDFKYNSGISIDKSLTINGQGHSIEKIGFICNKPLKSNITLKNINFINNNNTSIKINSEDSRNCNITIFNCNFTNINVLTNLISISNCYESSISYCNFINCSANDNSYYNYLISIYCNESSISYCNFTNNSIYALGYKNSFISNSNFNNSRISGYSCVIINSTLINSSVYSKTIINSNLTNCGFSGNNLINSTLYNVYINQEDSIDIINSRFNNGKIGADLGGIITIINSTLTNISDISTDVNANIDVINSTLTNIGYIRTEDNINIINSTLTNSEVSTYSGGNINIINSTLNNNGNISSFRDNVNIINSTLINNKAINSEKLNVNNSKIIENGIDVTNKYINDTGTSTPKNNNTNTNNTSNNNTGTNNHTTASKLATKIAAKKKIKIKAKKKSKYIITLKAGKTAVKKVMVYLKIGKKTIKAKTNNKGKATFKIKINKKGKSKAAITFKGNDNYKECSNKVDIIVK